MSRLTLVRLLVAVSLCASAQSQDSSLGTLNANHHGALNLATIGEQRFLFGRRGGFRIYENSDGKRARISYVRFSSVKEASSQIRQWRALLNEAAKQNKERQYGQKSSEEKIIGAVKSPGPNYGQHLIIIRKETSCYLIQAPELEIAQQVEKLAIGK